jgi:hypothetical protein
VLLGQSYLTPRGAVTDEWRNGGMMICWGIPKNSGAGNLVQCNFVYPESHLKPTETKNGFLRLRPASSRQNHGTSS